MMIAKTIDWFGGRAVLVCDAQCNKAWGRNSRPTEQLSEDEDDYVYLADAELGEAPADPGTSEGGDCKPQSADGRFNLSTVRLTKWCARECERATLVFLACEVPDFSSRVYNMPHLHAAVKEGRR